MCASTGSMIRNTAFWASIRRSSYVEKGRRQITESNSHMIRVVEAPRINMDRPPTVARSLDETLPLLRDRVARDLNPFTFVTMERAPQWGFARHTEACATK